ncbi:MAG: hypothetical protein NZ908_00385 [Candidatus Micrarchaeota archaeon]|nr:hypothetical protein [Candidatus Micrarchaeota archaeon]MCX8154630.1 hypothetical protein [Candidatus Micrarchaeota archaeon]
MDSTQQIQNYYDQILDSRKPRELHRAAIQMFTTFPDLVNRENTRDLVINKYKSLKVPYERRRELLVRILSSDTELHKLNTLIEWKRKLFDEPYQLDLLTVIDDVTEIYSKSKTIPALQYLILFSTNFNDNLKSIKLREALGFLKNLEQANNLKNLSKSIAKLLGINDPNELCINDIMNSFKLDTKKF